MPSPTTPTYYTPGQVGERAAKDPESVHLAFDEGATLCGTELSVADEIICPAVPVKYYNGLREGVCPECLIEYQKQQTAEHFAPEGCDICGQVTMIMIKCPDGKRRCSNCIPKPDPIPGFSGDNISESLIRIASCGLIMNGEDHVK